MNIGSRAKSSTAYLLSMQKSEFSIIYHNCRDIKECSDIGNKFNILEGGRELWVYEII